MIATMNAPMSRHLDRPEPCKPPPPTPARLMKALANPDRLLLLCQLSQGEMSVSELEAALGILQPTLSQQLGRAAQRGAGGDAARRQAHLLPRRAAAPALAVLKVLHEQFCCRKERR